MQKRAFLIHGWGGRPDGGFRPWLKKELESHGYLVEALAMPDSDRPVIGKWIPYLTANISSPDENTVLVGHSLGAPALLMYLEKLPETARVGKVILVAGAFRKITGHDTPEQQELARPWLESPINYGKIRLSATSIIAFFSDNDPWVPLKENSEVAEKLHAKVIVEHNMAHYNEDAGIKEVPSILKEILAD